MAQTVKNLAAMQETQVQSLGQEEYETRMFVLCAFMNVLWRKVNSYERNPQGGNTMSQD